MTLRSPLIDVEDLAELLAQPVPPTVLDVRWSLMKGALVEDFLAGHVPGAGFISLDTDLADPPGEGGRHPLPDADRAAAAFAAAGVSNGRPVVVYDGKDSSAAARAWWVLRWLGHTDVRVMDGGFAAWERANLPVATGEHPIDAGDFVGSPGALPIIEPGDALDPDLTLLDARAAERFRGETEPIDPVAGHIPGAVNAPTMDNVDSDGHFLPAAVLKDRFVSLGVGSRAATAAYCGSGVTACHTLLALERAGITGARLYPGSWSGWITDPTRPIATG